MKLFIRFLCIGILIALLWIGLDTFYVHVDVPHTYSKYLDFICYALTYLLWLWGSIVLFKKYTPIKKYGFRLFTAFILWAITLPVYLVITLSFHVAMGWSL